MPTNPFTVVVDDREKMPWTFGGIESRVLRKPVLVPVERKRIWPGDYSIEGMEDRIAIERKSVADLHGTIFQRRKNFVKELKAMNEMEFSAVIVEGEWTDIYRYDGSGGSKASLTGSIFAWMVSYPMIHWITTPGRRGGETAAFRLLERFWRNNKT